jgi:hypothetical protein
VRPGVGDRALAHPQVTTARMWTMVKRRSAVTRRRCRAPHVRLAAPPRRDDVRLPRPHADHARADPRRSRTRSLAHMSVVSGRARHA